MGNEPKPISSPLKEIMARIDAKRSGQGIPLEEHAKQVAAEIQKEIAPTGTLPPEQAWLSFAPMPNDLCRVSPFFPMAQKQMDRREFFEGMVISSNAWGEVTYTGPKLSTYEEDVLLAILALVKGDGGQESGWTYTGALLPILRVMGVKKVGGDNYRRVKSALKRLVVAGVCIQTKKGKWAMSTMITWAGGADKEKTVSVTVNSYFAEMFSAGSVNLLDLAKRAELSRPVSKALHRFVTSHRGEWRGHFLTLAGAINLDLDQPQKQIRRQLRQGMAELRKVGVLAPRCKFLGDVVTLGVINSEAKQVKT